jgi:serine/threonine protein kinase
MEDQVAEKKSESGSPPAMGKYVPFARLGHGGMADIFLAVARGPVGFNKLVVVKRLRNPDDNSRIEMFLDEARLSARLSHPNIVNTYEVGEAKGQFFIAMEYLEGQPLQALLRSKTATGGPLEETVAAFIAMQALKGLHYAHELTDYDGTPLQVVHRDVSPHNLFITYQGEVKLLDFGIAKAVLNSTQTETGVLKGKVRYMAPEQVGEKNVDRRADIFALGIVLWEMLAGRALYQGDVASILARITSEGPPLIGTVREDVSPELEAIVAKALRRDLDARYATADAMRADLEQFLRGKQDGADAALARMLNDGFAETRDAVRARIKTFLAEVPVRISGATSTPDLAQAAELLPALFGDGSGSGSGHGDRSGDAASAGSNNLFVASPITSTSGATAAAPRTSLVRWAAAASAALLVLGVLALRAKSAAPPPAPAAALPASMPAAAAVASTTPVHVESSPAGALVESNGELLGRTPVDLQLSPGQHALRLSHEGYEPQTLTLDVKAQMPLARAIELQATVAGVPAVTPHSHGASRPAPPARPRAQTPPPPAAPPTVSAPRPKIRVVDEDAP